MSHYSIAIDGPSGAGKSTLAKALAARLGFLYVDTGAIYRTVGLYAARQGADCGVDAFIVQDLGVTQLCRQIAPKIPVHGSTHMTVHSLAGVLM